MRITVALPFLALLVSACANNGTVLHCTGTCTDGGGAHDGGPPLDATAPLDAAHDASTPRDGAPAHDAGTGTDAATHVDAGAHLDAGGDVDAGTAIDAGTCPPGVACETLDFPNLDDTYSTTFYQATGDYLEGTRTASTPSATSAHAVLNVRFDDLSCDSLDFHVMLNGTDIGSFSITPPPSSGAAVVIDKPFTFAAITGPTYTIRYEVTHGVMSSCGPVVLETHGNTFMLAP